MSTDFYYELIDDVRRSLDEAGHKGYSLFRTDWATSWFNLQHLFDFLEEKKAEPVPLLRKGMPVPAFTCLQVKEKNWRRTLTRLDHHGIIAVRRGVAISVYFAVFSDGLAEEQVIVGEEKKGDLQAFLDEFCGYAHDRIRSERVITVFNGESIDRPDDLTWDDVVLQPELKEELRLQVEGFFGAREAYARMGVPYRRGLLMTGPPGNGKTSLLKVIASMRKEPFVLVTANMNTNQHSLDAAFNHAVFHAPAILCFEDLDSLFDLQTIPMSYFLNRLDGISTMEGVLVVATTNHPERLDVALTDRPSRFDRVFHLDNPEARERSVYLKQRFQKAFDPRLVEWTEGFSFAQLKEVWVSACLEALRDDVEEPTLDGALRAVQRLRGQKDLKDRDWNKGSDLGFKVAR